MTKFSDMVQLNREELLVSWFSVLFPFFPLAIICFLLIYLLAAGPDETAIKGNLNKSPIQSRLGSTMG